MYVMATTTQSAPWWGSSLLAGLFLLLGSGLTLLVTHRRAMDELKRKDQTRWDELILETAVKVETICTEQAGIGKVGYPRYIENATDRVKRHVELVDELNEAQSKFRFVASTPLRAAASQLYRAALHKFLDADESDTAFDEAHANFFEAVRRELRAN